MKKILKILGILIGLLVVALFVAWMVFNEKQPVGTDTAKADTMANKMLTAINKPAWDSINFIQWEFRGGHNYVWDKSRDLVNVQWEDYSVFINTDSQKGKVYKNGTEYTGDDRDKIVRTAIDFFNNDSFWLCAPYKIFDPGTSRSMVNLDDGREGVMITYSSGGTTPGDSYLWLLDENGMPKSYKMWASIIPVGGLEFTWDDWMTLPEGAKVAQKHSSKVLEVPIFNVKTGNGAAEFGLKEADFVAARGMK